MPPHNLGGAISTHRLSITAETFAVIVERDLGSGSSLPKLRELKKARYANLVDCQFGERDAAFNSDGTEAKAERAPKGRNSLHIAPRFGPYSSWHRADICLL